MKKEYKRNSLAAIIFLCYAGIMLYFLFIRNRSGNATLPYWEQVRQNFNLTPLHTIRNYWDVLTRPEHYIEKWGGADAYSIQFRIAAVNILGNVLLFIPFGAFLPSMWLKFQKAWKAFCAAVMTIVFVELLQLLTLRGHCDIDDLFLNMTGIMIGYALWRISHSKK